MRLIISSYALFFLIQLTSACLLYATKTGFRPQSVLESYQGSEKMRAIFPDEPDHFKEPRSGYGLLELACGHIMAYGLTGFIMLHWLRSLRPDAQHLAGHAFLLLAFLDALFPALVRFGPYQLAWIRPLVFLCFMATGFFLAAQLLKALLQNNTA